MCRQRRLRFKSLLLWIALGAAVSACNPFEEKEDSSSSKEERAPTPAAGVSTPVCFAPTGAYDGLWGTYYHLDGYQTALGEIEVQEGRFRGDLVSVEEEQFEVEGCVEKGGQLTFTRLQGNGGTQVQAQGQIRENTAEGTFLVEGQEGLFVGTRNHEPVDATPTTLFDGLYQVSFVREGSEKATAQVLIENGRFTFTTTNTDGVTFTVQGFVASDGVVVLKSVTSGQKSLILAEAYIDQETFTVGGLYRLGTSLGKLEGRLLKRTDSGEEKRDFFTLRLTEFFGWVKTKLQTAFSGSSESRETEPFWKEWTAEPQKIWLSSTPGWSEAKENGQSVFQNNRYWGFFFAYYWKLTRQLDLRQEVTARLKMKYDFKKRGYESFKILVGKAGAQRQEEFTPLREERTATGLQEVELDLRPYLGQVITVQLLLKKPSFTLETQSGLSLYDLRLLKTPQHVAESIAFSDSDPDRGQAAGRVDIAKASEEWDLTHYVLYWGESATSKLPGAAPIAVLPKTGGNLSYLFSENSVIPEKATHLMVFTKNNAAEMTQGVSVAFRDKALPLHAALQVTFSDTDLQKGEVAGNVRITRAPDESDVTTYTLYWASDATTPLASQAAIVTLPASGSDLSYAFLANTLLPEGATHLLVLTRNGDGEMPTGVSTPLKDKVVEPGAPVTPLEPTQVTLTDLGGGQVKLEAASGSVTEGGETVWITNPRTQETLTLPVPADHSFSVTLKAIGGDVLSLVVQDAAGNSSKPLFLTLTTPPPDPQKVAPPVDPTVATSVVNSTAFLYSGPSPIQVGMKPDTIEPRRIAVVRGKVLNNEGKPLSGVIVTILDHPEYGRTVSREDGLFDMAVNGGGWLTVDYAKEGYLPLQRKVNAPWQDYVWVEEAVMLSLDAKVTAVDLKADVPIQVAQGTPTQDQDGRRTATLLFPKGTIATMILPDGSQKPLTTLNVRATEYTIGPDGPKAMPALLPPTSGYTYAVEFTAQEALQSGAKSIVFDPPLPFYVENFLNFPVGEKVPVGSYDRDRGVWVPADDGRIIEVLKITDGLAEVDVEGKGVAASEAALAALKITPQERAQLARLYAVGQSLWRVRIPHFTTPWDFNWPWGLPKEAIVLNLPLKDSQPISDPLCIPGSIIDCQNQVLGEVVDIAGTPLRLHYQTDRVAGYRASRRLTIPLSGATLPPSLKEIRLEITVAGQHVSQTFPPQPNQSFVYEWDGKDAYGRLLEGTQKVQVRIGYAYPLTYYAAPADFERSFANVGSGRVIGQREGVDIAIWRDEELHLGNGNAPDQHLAGWSLNILHSYDPYNEILYLGTGTRRGAQRMSSMITTVVGTGERGFSGDGGPAQKALLAVPYGLVMDAQGNLYLSDNHNHRVRKVSPEGLITTIAGTGEAGFSGDGGPATKASLNSPYGLAVDAQGNLYIADSHNHNHRVRRISPEGLITTIAGTGEAGFSGDGGPAQKAQLNFPAELAVDTQGNLYIADLYNHRVRKVSPEGLISTIAGTGAPGFSGDGGPAKYASLYYPYGLAVDAQGNLYLVDSHNYRIRKVTPAGLITTIAGTGARGFSGDGGPAIAASFVDPVGLTLDAQGNLYLADLQNHRVRRISPEGLITTIAGTGEAGFSGDDGAATEARLNFPHGLAVDAQGNLYLADRLNDRIRKVSFSLSPSIGQSINIASEEGQELYAFDAQGKHIQTLNALTGAVLYTFSYNPQGQLSQIQDAHGNLTHLERDAHGRLSAIVSPYGQRTLLEVDDKGHLVRLSDPAGFSRRFTYTDEGLMTSFTDPNGNLSRFSYDESGRLLKDENAAGGSVSLARGEREQGFEVRVTTALKRTRRHAVETLPTGDQKRIDTLEGGLATETLLKKDGQIEIISPDGSRRITQQTADPRWKMMAPRTQSQTMTTPSGLQSTGKGDYTAVLSDPQNPLTLQQERTTFTLNQRVFTTETRIQSSPSGQKDILTLTLTPMGRQTTTLQNAQGQLKEHQLAGLEKVIYGYDLQGRLTAITQGERTLSFSYDAQGYLTALTNPLGETTRFIVNPNGWTTEQTLPTGSTIATSFDPNGNLTSLTPPEKIAHELTYTPVNLLQAYRPPLLTPNGVPSPLGGEGQGEGSTRYEYNLDKQVELITRPDGKQVDLVYEGTSGWLDKLVLPQGEVDYAYFPTSGQLKSITTPEGNTLSFAYDGFLLTQQSWSPRPLGEGQGEGVHGKIIWTYDNNFWLVAQTLNDTSSTTFQYDRDGLLTQAGDLLLLRRLDNGFLQGTTLGKVSTNQTYNAYGELDSYTAQFDTTTLYATTTTRDKLGRITRKVESLAPGGEGQGEGATTTFDYAYDAVGRLTEVRQNGTLLSRYTYDANGNRLLSSLAPGGEGQGEGLTTITATYDAQDRLTQYGNTGYGWTANGELKTKTTSLAPRGEGQGEGATFQTTSYEYDVLGNLRQVTLPNGTKIEYVIDGKNRRIGRKVNGTLTQGWLYQDQLHPVAELDGQGKVVSLFVYGDKPNVPAYMVRYTHTPQPDGQFTTTATPYRILSDHLGSPRLVVNASTGDIAQRLTYDEFGNVFQDTNPGFQPFGFAGGLYDKDIGLVRFGARDYEAKTGRWTQKDPILFNGGQVNLFTYVGNDPVNRIDPEGRQTFQCRRPLQGFDEITGPLFHEFLCAVDPDTGNVRCGGQTPSGGLYGPGKPSNDEYDQFQCKEIAPPNECMQRCVLNRLDNPARPPYGVIGPGTDCQEFAQDVFEQCLRTCRGRRQK